MSAKRSVVVALHRADTSTGRLALSDEALVAGVGVGDPAALGALYDRHHEAVARFVSRLTRAIADDVDDELQASTFAVPPVALEAVAQELVHALTVSKCYLRNHVTALFEVGH